MTLAEHGEASSCRWIMSTRAAALMVFLANLIYKKYLC